MKKLYFVRHGETAFNRARKWAGSTDLELTRRGHRQAKHAGKTMSKRGLSVDVIVSSPLKRARQTAEHIAEHIDYPLTSIVIYDDLTERNFGVFEGNSQIRKGTSYAHDESAIDDYEGVETLAELQARAEATLAYLHTLPYETILVVGHGAHGRALRRAVRDEPLHKRGHAFANAELVELI